MVLRQPDRCISGVNSSNIAEDNTYRLISVYIGFVTLHHRQGRKGNFTGTKGHKTFVSTYGIIYCELYEKMSDSEQSEIVQVEKEPQKTVVLDVLDFKKQKRSAKHQLTRLLTQLSCLLLEEQPNREHICQLLVRIDEQKEFCLDILEKLEAAYQHNGEKDNALKTGDELEKIAEQVDIETHASRQF